MRIIGGALRHRLIKLPTVRETRATRDAVREAVFSALGPFVNGTMVLDLFAGSGAYGLEALSRGASSAILTDHNDICVKTITDNLLALKLDRAEVWRLDYLETLQRLEKEKRSLDLVFLDPPYLDKLCETVILILLEKGLLTSKAVIVAETHKPLQIDETKFAKVKYYKYGITRIAIMWR